jgi:hypothetical protein
MIPLVSHVSSIWSLLLDNSDDLSLLQLQLDPHGDHNVEDEETEEGGIVSSSALDTSSNASPVLVPSSSSSSSSLDITSTTTAPAHHSAVIATSAFAVIHRNLIVLALAIASPLQLISYMIDIAPAV